MSSPPVAELQQSDVERSAAREKGGAVTTDDANLVAFAQPFDASNPKDWPARKKWTVISVMSATAFLRITTSTIVAPAILPIDADLHMSAIEGQMAISVYMLASAFGPLVLSPLSEVYGRQWVLHCSNVWFLIWNIVCGFAQTKAELIAARCLAGFGGSVAYALGNAVLGDIFRPAERGRSMALYFVVPLLGAAIGPIVGGYVAQYASWRWVFHCLSITQGLLVLLSFFMFQESHGPTILFRRAKHLRTVLRNSQLHTAYEALDMGRTSRQVLGRSLSRPLRLLAFHPIVQMIAVFQGISYGMLYIILTSFSALWVERYGLSIATSGLHYIAPTIGEVLGAQLCGPLMDALYRRLARGNDDAAVPETRVPLMLPGILLVPAGLLIYGWSAQYHVHWAVVDLGTIIVNIGFQLAGQPVNAYVIDAYPSHTSSATAASQFVRSLTAFAFPIFAPQLYDSLGYGWGNGLLALLFFATGAFIVSVLWFYGPKLRQKAGSSH